MLQPRDCSRGRVHYQLKLIHTCALVILISLVFYTMSVTDVHIKTAQSIKSWNISLHLQQAMSAIQSVMNRPKNLRKKKLILLWTDYFSKKDWLPSTTELDCAVKECVVTSERSMLKYSSAVIMHWRNIDIKNLPVCIPSKSAHCPLWVLFNKEAPYHTPRYILEAIQDRVHWTATYRKDSDIHAPYGKVVLKPLRSSVYSDFDPNRQLLCWLVSNCQTPSNRELFVNELENYIDVDIYGACGNMTCPHPLVKDCYKWMSNKCLFYLSLENSNCRDYTTEKLYYALASGMVPVVMGNNSNYEHLPPRSYVNVEDFSSPQELAEYLVNTGKNETTYLSYFWWERIHEVKDYSYRWYCDLCEKLHTTDVENVKPHKNLVSWWFDESQCTSWQGL